MRSQAACAAAGVSRLGSDPAQLGTETVAGSEAGASVRRGATTGLAAKATDPKSVSPSRTDRLADTSSKATNERTKTSKTRTEKLRSYDHERES